MKRYFAKLDGDMVGIDHYVGFFAQNDEEAQMIADQYAEDNYSQYDEPYEQLEDGEEGEPLFYATVEEWSSEKHDKYLGDACFTNHFN